MIHIYGHTWPVRWGKPGEDKCSHAHHGEYDIVSYGFDGVRRLRMYADTSSISCRLRCRSGIR